MVSQKQRLTSLKRNAMDDAPVVVKAEAPTREYRTVIRPQHRMVYEELQKPENKGQISKAMIAAGYADSTARVPSLITDSKSWAALMEEHLPESLLTLRHSELLNKRDTETVYEGRGKNRRAVLIDKGPNTAAVTRAIEMGYKLRGRLLVESPTAPPVQNVYNLFYKPEVRAQVVAFEDQLKHAIAHEISTTAPANTDARDTGEPDAGSVAATGGPDGSTVETG